jgi:hypothetical protein
MGLRACVLACYAARGGQITRKINGIGMRAWHKTLKHETVYSK